MELASVVSAPIPPLVAVELDGAPNNDGAAGLVVVELKDPKGVDALFVERVNDPAEVAIEVGATDVDAVKLPNGEDVALVEAVGAAKAPKGEDVAGLFAPKLPNGELVAVDVCKLRPVD